eukprot:jgi/Pico_ML_1/53596/g4120.t2
MAMAEQEVVDLTSPPGRSNTVICIDSDTETPQPAPSKAVVACDSDSLAEDEDVRALFAARRKEDRAESRPESAFQNLADIEKYLEERKEKGKAERPHPKTRPSAKRVRAESEAEQPDAKAKKAKEREEKKEKMRLEKLAAREAKKRANGYYKEAELTAVLDQSLASHTYGWQTMKYLQEKKLLYRIETIQGMGSYRCVVWKRHAPRKFEEEERTGRKGSEERIRYMVVVMKAEEFAEEVDQDPALSGLVDSCCKSQPGSSVLLVVEGLDALLRKREREGYKRVTEGRSAGELFARDKYEDALVDLTVHAEGMMYRCVRDSCEVAECIGQTHLSLAKQPYWKKKDYLDVVKGGMATSMAMASTGRAAWKTSRNSDTHKEGRRVAWDARTRHACAPGSRARIPTRCCVERGLVHDLERVEKLLRDRSVEQNRVVRLQGGEQAGKKRSERESRGLGDAKDVQVAFVAKWEQMQRVASVLDVTATLRAWKDVPFAWSVLVTSLGLCLFLVEWNQGHPEHLLMLDALPVSLLGVPVGFLLVFRSNNAYETWYSGLAKVHAILSYTKNMCRLATVWMADMGEIEQGVQREALQQLFPNGEEAEKMMQLHKMHRIYYCISRIDTLVKNEAQNGSLSGQPFFCLACLETDLLGIGPPAA